MVSQKKEKAHGRQGAHQVAGELLSSIAPVEESGAI